jgi:hypothetical protein
MKLADVFPRVLNRAWNHRQTHKPEVPLQLPHDFRPRGSFGVLLQSVGGPLFVLFDTRS